MSTARLFAPKAALLVTTVVIVFTAFVPPRTAFACLGEPPMPLRLLYTESDLVVVARFGRTRPVQLLSGPGERSYGFYLMETELKVSSTLKGEGNRSVVHVYHQVLKPNDGDYQHIFVANPEDGKALVFLTRRADGDGYEVTSDRFGVKRLDEASLKVYLQRLDELALILQQEKPDPSRIVEWLVRCAEEPATRWEGLEELSIDHRALLFSRNEKLREASETEEAEETAEADPNLRVAERGQQQISFNGGACDQESGDAPASPATRQFLAPPTRRGFFYEADVSYIKSVTDEQKNRLANILFNTRPITTDETPLIELVKEWKDPRLVPFLMAQLRSFEADPPEVVEALVMGLAGVLDDKELSKLAERYCQNASYEDEVSLAEEEEETDEAEAERADAASAESQDVAAEESAEADEGDEPPVFGNHTQQRSTRLQRFLARAEALVGLEQTAAR